MEAGKYYGLQFEVDGYTYWIHKNGLKATRDIMQAKHFHHAETVVHWAEYLLSQPNMADAEVKIVAFHCDEYGNMDCKIYKMNNEPSLGWLDPINDWCERLLIKVGLL